MSSSADPAPAPARSSSRPSRVALAALIVGFNLLLAHNALARRATTLARTRAVGTARPARHVERQRRRRARRRTTRAPTADVWVFSRGTRARGAARPAAVGRRGRAHWPLASAAVRRRRRRGHRGSTPRRSSAAGRRRRHRRRRRLARAVRADAADRADRLARPRRRSCSCSSRSPRAGCSRASLRPVARMTRQAAAWSEHDLDRRFALGEPHDELTELAATLDGLLDRLAASLRREQRFSAELSHELRTPLARVIAEAELALRRERDARGVPRGARARPPQRPAADAHRRRARRGGASRGRRRRAAPPTPTRSRPRPPRRVAGLAPSAGVDVAAARPERAPRSASTPTSPSASSSRSSRTPAATARRARLAIARTRRRPVRLHGRRRRARRRRRRARADLRARRPGACRAAATEPAPDSGSPSPAGSRAASPATWRPRARASASPCRAATRSGRLQGSVPILTA